MKKAQILWLLPWVVLLGCTVGPDYEPPETPQVPDAWKAAAAAEIEGPGSPLETWWTSLNDPKLVELVHEARRQNLTVRTAAARVREARARLGIATGQYYPDVVLDGSYSRSDPSENAVPPGVPIGAVSATDFYSLGVGFAWEIDVFGRLRRGAEAARADLETSIENYRDVMVILMADVAANYVEIRALQARIRYLEANVEAQAGSLQLTRDRFDAGLSPLTDVTQAEYNLANSQAGIPQLQARLAAAANRLAVLLGQPPGYVDELLTETSDIPTPDDSVALGIPADLMRRRPDIRAAERSLAGQTARIGVAKADLYPTFSLGGVLAVESLDAGELFDSGSTTWSLVPGVRWNLFAGGRIRSNIQVQEARTEQLLLSYEESVLRALDEVESTMVAYEREKLRRDRLAEAVDASQRTVELVRTQYMSGLTGFLNLLDAQRTLANQQDAYADSEGQVVQNLIALNRVLGGGWQPPDPDTTPVENAAEVDSATSDPAGSEP